MSIMIHTGHLKTLKYMPEVQGVKNAVNTIDCHQPTQVKYTKKPPPKKIKNEKSNNPLSQWDNEMNKISSKHKV